MTYWKKTEVFSPLTRTGVRVVELGAVAGSLECGVLATPFFKFGRVEATS